MKSLMFNLVTHDFRRPEDKFILLLCKSDLSDVDSLNLNYLLEASFDWNYFSQTCYYNRIRGLIHPRIKNLKLKSRVPKDVLRQFSDSYIIDAFNNKIRLEQTKIIAKRAEGRIVLLKGIALINTIYDKMGRRSMCDIDLLAERQFAIPFWHKVRSLGYVGDRSYKSLVHEDLLAELKLNNSNWKHLDALSKNVNNNLRVSVEIHSQIFKGVKANYYTNLAIEKSQIIENNTYILNYEFSLIHLCTHLCENLQDHNEYFSLLCDINELIEFTKAQINWKVLEELSINDEDLAEVLKYSLSLVSSLLNAVIPNYFNIEVNSLKRSFVLIERSSIQTPKITLPNYRKALGLIKTKKEMWIFVIGTILPRIEWVKYNFGINSNIIAVFYYLKYWKTLIFKTFL